MWDYDITRFNYKIKIIIFTSLQERENCHPIICQHKSPHLTFPGFYFVSVRISFPCSFSSVTTPTTPKISKGTIYRSHPQEQVV